MAERVGFIGLGIMGKPMVRNLLKRGFEVVVHNRSQPAIDQMVAEGAIAGGSVHGVAQQAKTIVLMLPDSPDVRAVALGSGGLNEVVGADHLIVDMSTISPVVTTECATALAKKGAAWVDAPVSGGERGAIDGTLSIMVGGSDADFTRATPAFEAMGRTIVHVGAVGAGQTVKACNQIVVALTYEAVSEALVLGSKAGVDPMNIVKVLNGGLAASRILELKGASMVDHNFQPGFRINLHRKDLGIAMSTAREFNVPLPVTALVAQMFESLMVAGRGNLDHSGLLTYLEDLARHTVTRPSEDE